MGQGWEKHLWRLWWLMALGYIISAVSAFSSCIFVALEISCNASISEQNLVMEYCRVGKESCIHLLHHNLCRARVLSSNASLCRNPLSSLLCVLQTSCCFPSFCTLLFCTGLCLFAWDQGDWCLPLHNRWIVLNALSGSIWLLPIACQPHPQLVVFICWGRVKQLEEALQKASTRQCS